MVYDMIVELDHIHIVPTQARQTHLDRTSDSTLDVPQFLRAQPYFRANIDVRLEFVEYLAQVLLGLSIAVHLYCTDKWAPYASVILQDKLAQSKATTHDIERNHYRQRHSFGRFKRKSIIISKSKEMVDLTMALFAEF
jgi:insertion element IS1 protein InsB